METQTASQMSVRPSISDISIPKFHFYSLSVPLSATISFLSQLHCNCEYFTNKRLRFSETVSSICLSLLSSVKRFSLLQKWLLKHHLPESPADWLNSSEPMVIKPSNFKCSHSSTISLASFSASSCFRPPVILGN